MNENKIDVLLGLQWGDEGKGKIIDALAPNYNIIVRFQGGPNAGHTLEFNREKHVLHMIPSGIFQPNKINIMADGMVIDPIAFMQEIDYLKKVQVKTIEKRIFIGQNAHLILPTHRLLDKAKEAHKGEAKIGTTGKGIGPCYTDKISRDGLQIGKIRNRLEFLNDYDIAKNQHEQLLKSYNYVYDQKNSKTKKMCFLKQLSILTVTSIS